MENASQALLIAGGVLLAILTLSLIGYLFNNLGIIGKAEKDSEEVERLKSWNEEWQSYNKSYLYGAEVLTVINKARESEDKVTVEVFSTEKIKAPDPKGFVSTKKTNIFACKSMEDTDNDGKIDYIVFTFLE